MAPRATGVTVVAKARRKNSFKVNYLVPSSFSPHPINIQKNNKL
jgi:hypothetical protein